MNTSVKRRQKDENSWKRNIIKKKRNSGDAFVNERNEEISAKKPPSKVS